jgi:hypothetical protein
MKMGAVMFSTMKALVLDAVRNGDVLLETLSFDFKNDKDIVLAAIAEDPLALEFASETLKNDPDVVWAAVEIDIEALAFASLERVKELVTDFPQVLQFSSKEVQAIIKRELM